MDKVGFGVLKDSKWISFSSSQMIGYVPSKRPQEIDPRAVPSISTLVCFPELVFGIHIHSSHHSGFKQSQGREAYFWYFFSSQEQNKVLEIVLNLNQKYEVYDMSWSLNSPDEHNAKKLKHQEA